MTDPVTVRFAATDLAALSRAEGRVALVLPPGAALDAGGRRIDRLVRGALSRAVASKAWDKLKPGESVEIGWPAGLAAEVLQLVRLDRRA